MAVNATEAIYILWKIVQAFLEEYIKKKISIHKENTCESLQKLFHPSQIEQRFGGTAPNVTKFWPPMIPSQEFGCHKENLVTVEQYAELVKVNPELKPSKALMEEAEQL